MLFCGYCGIVQRSDNLKAHCKKNHNDEFLALKPNEKPKVPMYKNWLSYVEEYPKIKGDRDLLAIDWWRIDGPYHNQCSQTEKKLDNKKNRGEKKAK